MSAAQSLADVRTQYAEIARLLDAERKHEKAEHEQFIKRATAREEARAKAELPVVPARGQNGRFVSAPAPTVETAIREAMLAMRSEP